jgi:hypothetical protein
MPGGIAIIPVIVHLIRVRSHSDIDVRGS